MVIIGDNGHPEVQAVVGSTENVVVVGNEDDILNLPENKKLGILCQTTQSPEYFGDMIALIVRKGFSEMKIIDTLCKEAIKMAIDKEKQDLNNFDVSNLMDKDINMNIIGEAIAAFAAGVHIPQNHPA